MMKTTLYSIAIIACSHLSFSQSEMPTDRRMKPQKEVSLKERYKFDYQLVNESVLGQDSLILLTISPSFLSANRSENEDVIVFCSDINAEIIIYSEQRVRLNKQNTIIKK